MLKVFLIHWLANQTDWAVWVLFDLFCIRPRRLLTDKLNLKGCWGPDLSTRDIGARLGARATIRGPASHKITKTKYYWQELSTIRDRWQIARARVGFRLKLLSWMAVLLLTPQLGLYRRSLSKKFTACRSASPTYYNNIIRCSCDDSVVVVY